MRERESVVTRSCMKVNFVEWQECHNNDQILWFYLSHTYLNVFSFENFRPTETCAFQYQSVLLNSNYTPINRILCNSKYSLRQNRTNDDDNQLEQIVGLRHPEICSESLQSPDYYHRVFPTQAKTTFNAVQHNFSIDCKKKWRKNSNFFGNWGTGHPDPR